MDSVAVVEGVSGGYVNFVFDSERDGKPLEGLEQSSNLV